VLRAYEHRDKWVNRMILGDSLVVMNSLLEYEGLGGQVQMIYMDPPHGVKFGSNFQPFVGSATSVTVPHPKACRRLEDDNATVGVAMLGIARALVKDPTSDRRSLCGMGQKSAAC
jgi:hypothetical protein